MVFGIRSGGAREDWERSRIEGGIKKERKEEKEEGEQFVEEGNETVTYL